MPFQCTAEERNKISSHFGLAFYERVNELLLHYSQRWQLEVLQLIDYYSINCLFIVRSAHYGDCILKLCPPSHEIKTEIYALRAYEGHGFATLYDCDLEAGVLMIERIMPGTALRAIPVTEERIANFAKVYRTLHIKAADEKHYPTYLGWVDRISRYMSSRDDRPELKAYMLEAAASMHDLSSRYPKRLLLHGDLHHDNLLLDEAGRYRLVDPKGVIGDPLFDLPRFVLNEYLEGALAAENIRHLGSVMEELSRLLSVNLADLATAHFIEAAMGNAWMLEDGKEPNLLQVEVARLLSEIYR